MIDPEVKIRPLTLSDRHRLVDFANNENVARNLRDAFPHPYTLHDATQFIERVADQSPTMVFAIVFNGLYVGNIGLQQGIDVYRKTAEMGYLLDENFWNKGIMTRAVNLVSDYGFRELNLVKIWAGVFDFNLASKRVLEKGGFKLEAILEKAVFKNNQVHDEYRYARFNPTGV